MKVLYFHVKLYSDAVLITGIVIQYLVILEEIYLFDDTSTYETN